MPDLDLFQQAEQGCMRVGRASPAILSGLSTAASNAGYFAADLLQKQQALRRRFAKWLYPAQTGSQLFLGLIRDDAGPTADGRRGDGGSPAGSWRASTLTVG